MKTDILGLSYQFPLVNEVIQKLSLSSDLGKVILVIGQPGSGKSVFMRQLYSALDAKIKCLTAVSAELLEKNESPRKYYGLFLKYKDIDNRKVLLLDSIDVLAYSRKRELQEWLFYVNKLKEIKGMTVVCASRNFEAEHLYPMNQQEWSEKINITPLPDEFINSIFGKLQYDYRAITPQFREFLKVPLYLRIVVDVIERGGDPKDIYTLHGLYAKLFELLNISTGEMAILTTLAEQMIRDRTLYLAYPTISVQLLEAVRKMRRPGLLAVITIDSSNQRLSFSHQTLIDYFVAWKNINEDKSLIDFILEHKQSLFIRPTLKHILGFLRSSSEKRLFAELSSLFFKQPSKEIGFYQGKVTVRTHIKTAILADMASWDRTSVNEAKFLLRIFNEAPDKQILMIQFFNSNPTVDWYKSLKDLYILPAIKQKNDTNIEYRTILSFVTSIAKSYPSEIFEVSSLLLKQDYNRMIEWFFRRISDELNDIMDNLDSSIQNKYVDLIEEVIRKGFAKWYYEILVFCKRIAKYSPQKAIRLYLDYVLEELQDKDSKINSSQGSLAQSFNEVLPPIYQRIPYETLLILTDFFEEILSENCSGERKLWDYPDELLYAEHSERFGLNAFYYWYKNRLLEFCNDMNEDVKKIILKLEDSKWISQRQLSMLCKTHHPLQYKNDLLSYVKMILSSDLNDNDMFKEDELYFRALRKIFDAINEDERNDIISCILRLHFEDRLKVRIWIWAALHNIPERYHSRVVTDKLKEISQKYNLEEEYKYKAPLRSTSFQAAQPPVPADVLRNKAPEELYNFLVQNRELKHRWDYDENKFFGGVEQLAQVVASVFWEDLGKYKKVIQKLSIDSANDEYIAWFFISLSQKDIPLEQLDWIIDIAVTVYTREKVGKEIVRFIEKISDIISEEHLNKLKEVIINLSKSKDPQKDTFFDSREKGYSNDALTDGINTTRGSIPSLVIKLLSRYKEEWLTEILITLSKDPTISVRASLVRYLPYAIRSLGWDKCFKIFSNAFEKGPEEYHKIIIDFLRYVPKDKFLNLKDILFKLKSNIEGPLGETYSVLMTIYYLRKLITEDDLMDILNNSKLNNEARRESFDLLANQVRFEETVDLSLKILMKLVESSVKVAGRSSIIFRQARIDDFIKFIPLIEKILQKPKIRGESLYYILGYLEKCLLIEPIKVFELLEKILNSGGEDFYNLREFIPASHSKAPLNIINTILECFPEYEEKAMKLLDKLIELRWEGVKEYLHAFDRL